ncbi:MAG: hypothetical protein M3177_00960 [Pseudomonadota bacterium]|nr:hypothetical protein [Pseudomonadota bacterium]
MEAAIAPNASRVPGRRRKSIGSPFYTGVGAIMLVLAVAGFWPQYYTVLAGGAMAATSRHWLIHIHSAMFLGWLLMFILQAALLWRGRLDVHRRLGPWMAGYGFLAVALGVVAGIALAARFGRMNGGLDAAANFVAFPLIDMLFLGGFLTLAVVYRYRRELHKRAMFVATFSIAVVGIGRLVARFVPLDLPWLWQPAILSPLLLALIYDGIAHRRLHLVIATGLAVHAFRLNMEGLTGTEAWLSVGRVLVGPFW